MLKDLDINMSDHYLIQITVTQCVTGKTQSKDQPTHTRKIKWYKFGKEIHTSTLRQQIISLYLSELNCVENIENYT